MKHLPRGFRKIKNVENKHFFLQLQKVTAAKGDFCYRNVSKKEILVTVGFTQKPRSEAVAQWLELSLHSEEPLISALANCGVKCRNY